MIISYNTKCDPCGHVGLHGVGVNRGHYLHIIYTLSTHCLHSIYTLSTHYLHTIYTVTHPCGHVWLHGVGVHLHGGHGGGGQVVQRGEAGQGRGHQLQGRRGRRHGGGGHHWGCRGWGSVRGCCSVHAGGGRTTDPSLSSAAFIRGRVEEARVRTGRGLVRYSLLYTNVWQFGHRLQDDNMFSYDALSFSFWHRYKTMLHKYLEGHLSAKLFYSVGFQRFLNSNLA